MTPEEVTREVRRIEITTRHLVRDIVAGEYPSVVQGARHGVRRGARVPARRRRAHHRLERHRPTRLRLRQALPRGAGADGHVRGGRERVGRLRLAPADQERPGDRGRAPCSPSRPPATTTGWARCSSPTASSGTSRPPRADAMPCVSSASCSPSSPRRRHRSRCCAYRAGAVAPPQGGHLHSLRFSHPDFDARSLVSARRHDVVALHLVDPRERSSPTPAS